MYVAIPAWIPQVACDIMSTDGTKAVKYGIQLAAPSTNITWENSILQELK